jgi:hypothetical protein
MTLSLVSENKEVEWMNGRVQESKVEESFWNFVIRLLPEFECRKISNFQKDVQDKGAKLSL